MYYQELVGKEVTIALAGDQLRTSFYYKSGEKERLVLVIGESNIPLLMILETDLGGIGSLYQKIAEEEPFPATVLAAVNISFEEGMYALNAACSTYEVLDSEQFSFDDGVIPTEEGEYIGVVGLVNNETVRFLKGSQSGDPSDGLQDNFHVFYRMFDRFGLNQYLE